MGCLQNQLSLPPGEELYVIIVADDVRQIQTLNLSLTRVPARRYSVLVSSNCPHISFKAWALTSGYRHSL